MDGDVDLYTIGSDASILSPEPSTYRSGRYVRITIFPFSFREFLEMHPVTTDIDRDTRLQQYIRTGGFPLTDPDEEDGYNLAILDCIYHSILMKDVATRRRSGTTGIVPCGGVPCTQHRVGVRPRHMYSSNEA